MTDKSQELAVLAQAYEKERRRNFANPPKNCKHELVYHKEGDNIHCHYCDKFLYRADQD